MTPYRIAERYAKALIESIPDDTALDPALQAMNDAAGLEDNHEFRSLLANPALPLETRLAVLDELLAQMETPTVVANMIRLLLRRGRLRDIGRVATTFRGLVDARLGRVTARVTTAVPLQPDQESMLKASLEGFAGKQVLIESEVDPAVVGGAVARFGHTVIDGTLRSRLERLKRVIASHER
jgi:F-type H+-transporting ATPase subunit delta